MHIRGVDQIERFINLVSRIESALGQKIFAFGIFLDVEGAFDNTSLEATGKTSGVNEVHSTISRWIAACPVTTRSGLK
jgi:hypothetical protein